MKGALVGNELWGIVEPVKELKGRPRKHPDKLHADKAYDFPRCRRYLRMRGIKARIARRGIDSSEPVGPSPVNRGAHTGPAILLPTPLRALRKESGHP
jgi:hypothetical protein